MTHASYTIQPKRKRHSTRPTPRKHRGLSALLGSSSLISAHAVQVAALGACVAGLAVPLDAYAVADPSTLTTVLGSTSSTLTAPGHLATEVATDRAVINAPNVNVLEGESWRIHGPSSSSALLVRATDGSPTLILGALSSNGQLMLYNGSGVLFGKNAQVDVASLVVSTRDISTENFKNGILKFDGAGRADASIINHGTITAKEGGLVALLAPGVQNDGVISAKAGNVVLASGNAFTVDFYGDNLYSFTVDEQAKAKAKDENGKDLTAAVDNTGAIKAGRVYMTANAARDVVDRAINTTGIVEATNAHMDGGDIVLDGGDGIVSVGGNLKATGGKGGTITVASNDTINLASDARVDASGDRKGGVIRIGGDKHGKGTLANARNVNVAKGAVIDASAQSGDAGDVTVWSDKATRFAGRIDISSKDGNGGNAEVSSKDQLTYTGTTNALGKNFGTLLLDPGNWTISTAASDVNTYNNVDLQNQLALANVTINTTSAAPQPGNLGDINVNADVTWSNASLLQLNAEHDININAKLVSKYAGPQVTTNEGGLFMYAGNDINIAKTITSGNGQIYGQAGHDLSIKGTAQANSASGNVGFFTAHAFSSNTKNSINTGGEAAIGVGTNGLIQNSIDALGAVGKAQIILSAATYNENVVIDTNNLTLQGAGQGATTINGVANKSQTGTVTVANGVTNAQIGRSVLGVDQGMTINGVTNGKAAVTNAAVSFLGNNSGGKVTSVALHSTGNTNGIYVNNNSNIILGGPTAAEGNIISNIGGDGIRLNNVQNITVANNTISNTAQTGIYSNTVTKGTYTNNSIKGANSAIYGAMAFLQGANLHIGGNTIDGSKLHGIYLTKVGGLNLIENNTIDHVVSSGIALGQSNGVSDFSQGTTIQNNVIGLVGGSNSGSAIGVVGSAYTKVLGNTIDNFHGGVNVNSGSVGTVVDSNTITLPDAGGGITVDTGSNNVRISNNVVSGSANSFAAQVGNSTGVSFTDDTFQNNLVGIRLQNAKDTVISGATLNNNYIGIYALQNSSNTKVANTHFSNTGIAVTLEDAGTNLGFTDNNSTFSNITSAYFYLGKGAMAGETLDASQQIFAGTRAQDFSQAEFAAARAKTVDSETFPSVGFVFYDNQVIVPVVPTVLGGISQELLDQLLERNNAPLRDVFSYSGKTIDASYQLSPYNFSVQGLNLSLLSPSAGGPVAPVTPGTVPAGASLGDLSPSAGGNADSPTGTALSSLSPSAGGSLGDNCANSFLADGLSGGDCGATAQ